MGDKEKKKIEKPTKIILIIVTIVVAIFILLVCYSRIFIGSWFGARAYQGPRITINMHITVDGEKAKIEKHNIPYSSVNLEEADTYTTLKARANDYYDYKYTLLVNEKIPVTLLAYHLNCWEITKSDIYIDINTKTNSYTTYEKYSYTAEAEGTPNVYIENEEVPKKTVKNAKSICESVGPF